MNTSQLIISDIIIRQDDDNRFCLNDLHRAAGSESRHKPSEWLRNKQTIELVAEIEKAGITAIQSKQQLGTFGVKPLVYAYAMWISPVFHLHVIRAYDALVTAKAHVIARPVLKPEPMATVFLTYQYESMLGLQDKQTLIDIIKKARPRNDDCDNQRLADVLFKNRAYPILADYVENVTSELFRHFDATVTEIRNDNKLTADHCALPEHQTLAEKHQAALNTIALLEKHIATLEKLVALLEGKGGTA